MRRILQALGFCVAGNLLDVATTLCGRFFHAIEQNPFARYASGGVNVGHLLALKVAFLGQYGLYSWVIWTLTARWPRRYREAVTILPLLYYAWSGFDGGVDNLWVFTRWATELN